MKTRTRSKTSKTIRRRKPSLHKTILARQAGEAEARARVVQVQAAELRRNLTRVEETVHQVELRELLEEILPNGSQFLDFAVERDFPRIGLKKMPLNARRLSLGDDKQSMILLAIEEVAETAKT
jgi:hypothetical protein